MVAWFIIAIATLAVFGFIAVSGVQTVAMTSDAAGRVETVRRLDALAQALQVRAASPANDGQFFLPAGVQGSSAEGYNPPSDLSVQTVTPFGAKFVYCPYGLATGTGTALTITSANGSSYPAATALVDGKGYVVGGRPNYPGLAADPNVIGIIMAPRTKLSAVPSCDQVTFANGKFTAPDAVVKAISRMGGVNEARTTNAREAIYFVSPGGTGSGGSAADPASLETALSFYRTRFPPAMRIKMLDGNYQITPTSLDVPPSADARGLASTLAIEAATVGSPNVYVDAASAVSLRPRGNLEITNVSFASPVMLVGDSDRAYKLTNATLGSLLAFDSKVSFVGTVSFTGATSGPVSRGACAVQLSGANAHLNIREAVMNSTGATICGFYLLDGSALSIASSTVTLSHPTELRFGILGDYGTKVTFSRLGPAGYTPTNFYLNAPIIDTAISTFGELNILQTTMVANSANFGRAISASYGARVTIWVSTLFPTWKPRYGIFDNAGGGLGMSSVSGTNAQIYATQMCWGGSFGGTLSQSGGIFAMSGSGFASGVSTSAVTADEPVPTMSAAPTSAEVQAYSEAVSRNTRRANARISNTSRFTCNFG